MSESIDRRKFLAYTGAAGAATGAAWVAPSVLGSTQAFAAGSCQETHQINWANYVGDEFKWVGNQQSQSQDFTLTPTLYGPNTPVSYPVTMTVTQVGTFDQPQAQVDETNFGLLNNTYRLWMTGNSVGAADKDPNKPYSNYGWDVTFTWEAAHPAYHLNLTMTVIDEHTASPGYRDIIYLTPERFFSTASAYFSGTGTEQSPWKGSNGTVTGSSIAGNLGASDTQSGPLQTLTISYRGDSSLYGALQSIGINNLSWCP